jgi:RND family efflux transporter MFP subunit
VEARWTTELTAEVSGRVDYVSDELLSGSHFDKGDVLVKINAVDYESEVATAEANVAAARVVYLEQQQETRQAKERWELSGLSGTPSNLALQTPQLSEALSSLNSAKAALAKAKKDLARTEIIAPFNGRVSERNINLGGYVSTGTSIATLFSTDIMEVNVALNEKQFALIGDERQALNRPVNLTNTADETGQWTGRIARFQYHVDSTERTRNLVLTLNAVDNKNTLLPGTFVKAVIPGKNLDALVKLPASALSPNGYVWYVKDGVLARFTANLIYQFNDYLVVKAPENTSALQVVRHPQMAFLPGQPVHAQTVAGQPSDPVGAAQQILPIAGTGS